MVAGQEGQLILIHVCKLEVDKDSSASPRIRPWRLYHGTWRGSVCDMLGLMSRCVGVRYDTGGLGQHPPLSK